ncbi:MAG: hypothetical protein OEZ65_00595 [Gemmatimonadota bacterium]|nr:hypothetical protein [Gemmatimonadota bacterium]
MVARREHPSTLAVLRRLGSIGVMVAGMLVVVVFFGPSGHDEHDYRAVAAVDYQGTGEPIAAEADVFFDLHGDLDVVSSTEESPHIAVSSLEARRSRRAFPGAPPFIPHELRPELQRTQDCAPCHSIGGYTPEFVTYAPRTPHPTYSNCLQCHVPRTTDDLFRSTDWATVAWPSLGTVAFEGAPPIIPHRLDLRTNCLTCHGGPAAAREIKTTHPERFNCRQCHVTRDESEDVFSRPMNPEDRP